MLAKVIIILFLFVFLAILPKLITYYIRKRKQKTDK